MTEVEQLQQKVKDYESILGIGQYDLAKRSFISFCKAVRKLSDRAKNITESEGGFFNKEDTDLVSKMPKMINDLIDLRERLKLSGAETEEAFVDGIADKRN